MACPNDFSIEYSWQSGSVPPPYYYEYTVTIHSDGRGWVTLLPDYPQNHPQPRRAEFFIAQKDFQRLWETMHASGLFEHGWKPAQPGGPIGGEAACLTIRRGSEVIQVPYLLSMVDGLRFAPVYEAIRDLAAETVEHLRSAGR